MLGNRALSGLPGLRLHSASERSRGFDRPPVIEDPRDMPDACRQGLLRAAQDEIVVLAALEPGTKSADLLHQASAEGAEMAEGVLRQHQRRVPVGLEDGIEASA